jgi:hypothetical protein
LHVNNFIKTSGVYIDLSQKALKKSLGTAILTAAVHCPDIVHRIFAIGEDKLLVVAIALGLPRKDVAVNAFERKRAMLEEFVRWLH